jgi:hypothetical protein
VKQLGASALAGWSAVDPAFVAYVAGRISAKMAHRRAGQRTAVMR